MTGRKVMQRIQVPALDQVRAARIQAEHAKRQERYTLAMQCVQAMLSNPAFVNDVMARSLINTANREKTTDQLLATAFGIVDQFRDRCWAINAEWRETHEDDGSEKKPTFKIEQP